MHEYVFRRRMKLNERICVKKAANRLYFYKGHNEGQPN